MIIPGFALPRIDDVVVLDSRGPWPTKSGGQLNVLFSFALGAIQDRYFHCQDAEVEALPIDIRGFRTYSVTGLTAGRVGGRE